MTGATLGTQQGIFGVDGFDIDHWLLAADWKTKRKRAMSCNAWYIDRESTIYD